MFTPALLAPLGAGGTPEEVTGVVVVWVVVEAVETLV